MNEYGDLKILGIGKQSGGRFGKVLIAGSGKIEGSVECEEFSVPGSGKVEDGDLTVHGPISCYGAGKVEGNVRAERLEVYGAFSAEGACEILGDAEITGSLKAEGPCSIDGSAKINGTVRIEKEFRAGNLQVHGVLKTEGAVRAEVIDVAGVLRTEGDVQAEAFRAAGPVTIEGELNADKAELLLSGEDEIESIVGGSVKVQHSQNPSTCAHGGLNARMDLTLSFCRVDVNNCVISSPRPHLTATLIEADEIDLEYTDCETVRGVNVHIGNECVIDRVEYSGSFSADPRASVGCTVKV